MVNPQDLDGGDGLLVTKHERCECGHCRCAHEDGYGACLASRDHGSQKCRCVRYTWPGRGADLPANHRRARMVLNADRGDG